MRPLYHKSNKCPPKYSFQKENGVCSYYSMAKPEAKIKSYATPRTPEGRLSISLTTTKVGRDNALELRIEDQGIENVLAWSKWVGTKNDPKAPGSLDSASIVMAGQCGLDAFTYGLWKASDGLFALGFGASVLDTRLSLYNLQRFLRFTTCTFEVLILTRTDVEGQYGSLLSSTSKDISALPGLAHDAFIKNYRHEVFLTVAIRVVLPDQFRPDFAPLMIYRVATEATLGHDVDLNREPTLEDFFFDCRNEVRMLEELLANYFLLASRAYAEGSGMSTSEVHSDLRQLAVMHDLAVHHKKASEALSYSCS